MELQFTTLDVFTSTPYEGNPLAVVTVPTHLRGHLSQAQKQKIALEFNLSEVLFLHEPTSESTNEWEVDIFTSTDELPFAGHPTIGAAFYVLHIAPKSSAHSLTVPLPLDRPSLAVLNLGLELPPTPDEEDGFKTNSSSTGTLITKAGAIRVSKTVSEGLTIAVSANIPHDVHIHSCTLSSRPARAATTPDSIASLGLHLSPHPVIAAAEKVAPIVSIVKGMTFLLVNLPSLEILSHVQGERGQIDFFGILDRGWDKTFVAIYYYVLLPSRDKDSRKTRIRSRMIEATMEDPATGSAACALGSYLAMTGTGSGKYEITQGVEMGRRSVIGVDVALKEGGTGVESILLSGSAVKVMEGKLWV
jgi:PhzF family phenazine biosynthesis protein